MAPCSCSPSLCRDCAGPARCARCGSGLSSSGSGTSPQALFQNVGVGTWESPVLDREGPVLLLEAYPASGSGSADVEVFDAAPGAPLTAVLDGNGRRTVTTRTKWPVRGVLARMRARITVRSGAWSVWAGFVREVADPLLVPEYARNGSIVADGGQFTIPLWAGPFPPTITTQITNGIIQPLAPGQAILINQLDVFLERTQVATLAAGEPSGATIRAYSRDALNVDKTLAFTATYTNVLGSRLILNTVRHLFLPMGNVGLNVDVSLLDKVGSGGQWTGGYSYHITTFDSPAVPQEL